MAPSTRTSATPARSRAGASSVSNWRAMAATRCRQRPSSSRLSEAQATAQASGLPMKVGPCMNTPGSPREMVSATPGVVRVAARVMVPPVIALPTQRMSGATPACSAANIRPVRPKPVAISSKMSRVW